MATAAEYAQWIVSNADKRGTPEFDTVAKAYQLAKAQASAAPAPAAAPASAPFSFGDTATAFAQGLVGTGKSLTDIFGADNPVSAYLGETQKSLEASMTPERRAEIKRRQALEKQAAKSGSLVNEISTFLGGVAEAPVQSLAQGLASIVPYVGTGILGVVRGLGAPTITAINTVIGTLQGTGSIKGSIYDKVEEELKKNGMSPAEAAAKAAEAQKYLGRNLPDIAAGAALGAAGARFGVENLLTKQGAKKAAQGITRRVATAAAAEAPIEGAQGAQEQIAQNRALQKEGFNVPTFQGAAGAAARDALVGALTAGAVGTVRGPSAAAPETPPPTEETPPPVTPAPAAASTPAAAQSAAIAARVQERNARVEELAQRIAERGVDIEEARGVAAQRVAAAEQEQEARDQEVIADINKGDYSLAKNIPKEALPYLDAGFSLEDALAQVEKDAAAAVEDRKTAKELGRQLKKGKKNAAKSDAQPAGTSPVVAEQPSDGTPTGGLTGVEPAGLARTAEPTEQPVAGAGQQPAALTAEPQVQPQAEAEQTQTGAEAPAQPAATTTSEEIPSGAQTAETVQAETQRAETAPATNAESAAETAAAAPAGAKRGRKPRNLTPEQLKREQRAKAEWRAESGRTDYALNKIKEDLDAAAVPLKDEQFETDEAQEEAQNDLDDLRRDAIKRLLTLADNKKIPKRSAVGQRLQKVLEHPSITPKEVEAIKQSLARAKKTLAGGLPLTSKTGLRGKPIADFSRATNAAQALTIVAKYGTPFQKAIANLLRRFVTNVEFSVVEKGDPTPERLSRGINGRAWERANGIYLSGNKKLAPAIYVRGASFGNGHGVDVITVLHEILHAATNKRILNAMQASFAGAADTAAIRFVRELNYVMANAEAAYEALKADGLLDPEVVAMVEATRDENGDAEIFSLPQEFLAYGMTSPVFQEFLMQVDSRKDPGTGFSGFVRAIMRLFGIEVDDFNASAFSDLVDLTDKILRAPETKAPTPAQETASASKLGRAAYRDDRTEKELEKDVAKAIKKVETSATTEELAKAVSAAELIADPAKALGPLRRAYDAASYQAKRFLLSFSTTDFLAEEWGGSQVPRLKAVNKNIREMHGYQSRLMEGAGKVSNALFNMYKKDPSTRSASERLALIATLAEIDPSVDKRSARINKLWNAASADVKKAFTLVRDYFEDMSAMYSKLLDDQIDSLSISAKDKDNILTKIKGIYETGQRIVPYFALVRRGQYWLQVGKGENRQFYMFESMMQRDKAAEALAAEMKMPLAQLENDELFRRGNDVRDLRNTFAPSSTMLTSLFADIDGMQLAGLSEEDAQNRREELKDAVYQLYLTSMPEQRLRKQFIHRKGITGFSTDMLRNFSDTSSSMAIQLSRIKYAPKIRNEMSAAVSSIAGQPNLEPFVEEMADRVALELPGATRETKLSRAADTAASFATRAAFIQYLSGASSAILQPLSVFQFGSAVLGARYGYGRTAAEMAKMMRVWNSYGTSTKNADGSITYNMPTLRTGVSLTPLERMAMDKMVGQNVATVTLTSELLGRKQRPTEQTLSTPRNIARQSWWIASGGALMHSAERISQEMVYLASFRLQQSTSTDKFKNSAAYKDAADKNQALADFDRANMQKWVDQAVIDTHESLGNMAAENRPPLMRNPGGKVLLQFNMFPLHATIFLAKNFFRMIKPLPGGSRAEAAKIFWGTMGTTSVLAGSVGLPLYTLLGFLSAMWRDADDEDKPKELVDLDFRSAYRIMIEDAVRGYIGTDKLDQKRVDEISDVLERGLANKLTGADFSSRLGLTNLFVRDGKETRTPREAGTQFLIEHLGPSVNQALAYADAYRAYTMGDYRTAVEKAAPAAARNFIVAGRLKEEGAKDTKGANILSKDSIKNGELLWQAVGFRSDLLANAQAASFRAYGVEQRINNERNDVLERIRVSHRNLNMDNYVKALDAVRKFNLQYPSNAIDEDTIYKTILSAAEKRAGSWRGFNLTEKNAARAMQQLSPSRRALAEREQEARK